jgi:hypothetical protein
MSLATDLTVDVHTDLGARVEHLAAAFASPDDGALAPRVLAEAGELLRAFQAAEARYVSLAVADPSFPFAAVQERLGSLRRVFGAIVQVAVDVLRSGDSKPETRAELQRVALLARSAPMTTADDVAALRSARAARPRRTSAVA